MNLDLYPHQEKAVSEMHNGCILAGDVGVGKTRTALAYALLKEPGRDIYVITTAKKRDSGDWQHEAALLAVPFDKIIVDSWNNIKHYHKVHGAFFIFDEQRLVGTGAWVKTFLDIARKNRWVLLSATPGDTWLDYVPVFIANGFYKNITEFRNQHVVYSRYSKFPKVEKYLNPGLLQRRRKLLLVEMPLVRETTRHIQMIECDYDSEVFDQVWKRRWNVYSEEPLKDAGELFRVGRKVVGTDGSRLEAVKKLLLAHPKLIVFYNFDYELEVLRTLNHDLAFLDWTIAEWNGHKHEAIPDTDKWVYLVQYTAGSEGWNCVETDAMCFYSMTYSYKQFYQAQGRIDRMNTSFSDLWYYVLNSKSLVDKAVWRALQSKKDFNVRRYSW